MEIRIVRGMPCIILSRPVYGEEIYNYLKEKWKTKKYKRFPFPIKTYGGEMRTHTIKTKRIFLIDTNKIIIGSPQYITATDKYDLLISSKEQ
jgi:hypothetical protein